MRATLLLTTAFTLAAAHCPDWASADTQRNQCIVVDIESVYSVANRCFALVTLKNSCGDTVHVRARELPESEIHPGYGSRRPVEPETILLRREEDTPAAGTLYIRSRWYGWFPLQPDSAFSSEVSIPDDGKEISIAFTVVYPDSLAPSVFRTPRLRCRLDEVDSFISKEQAILIADGDSADSLVPLPDLSAWYAQIGDTFRDNEHDWFVMSRRDLRYPEWDRRLRRRVWRVCGVERHSSREMAGPSVVVDALTGEILDRTRWGFSWARLH
jgi:hypothetical protein